MCRYQVEWEEEDGKAGPEVDGLDCRIVVGSGKFEEMMVASQVEGGHDSWVDGCCMWYLSHFVHNVRSSGNCCKHRTAGDRQQGEGQGGQQQVSKFNSNHDIFSSEMPPTLYLLIALPPKSFFAFFVLLPRASLTVLPLLSYLLESPCTPCPTS